MRQAYTAFVEANIPRFQRMLDKVEKESPAEALNIIARFSEFCLPKLMRAEVTGEDGAALIPPTLSISFASGGPGRGGNVLPANEEDDSVVAVVEKGAAAAALAASK